MPRNYRLKLRCSEIISRHFAVFGMGSIKGDYPLFADACNERGVCIAGLNFSGNAQYSSLTANGKVNLAPFELIPYLLARCATAKDAMEEFLKINMVDVPFDDATSNTPLHFHLADKYNSYVLEFTESGGAAYENPYGVLTNNPPFPYHLENAKLYMHLSNKLQKKELFCCGVGAIGLPGDYTSPSRFVKAAWLVGVQNGNRTLSLSDVFDTLRSVAPPRQAVINDGGKEHFTRYTAVIDAEKLEYHYLKNGTAAFVCAKADTHFFDTDTVIMLK